MKKTLLFFMLLWSLVVVAQIPSYYDNVNLTLSGTLLKDELATKIISTHTTNLSYTPGVWDALKLTDLDPTDANKVVLIYGWDDSDGDSTNDRTRDKLLQDRGSGDSFVWNREHVFSKSLANPNLGTSGPGADAHNLRPADRTRNTSRSNRKFADGSGAASYITTEGNWYPGDEWKGDVARMMMYMYLRYGNQTLPTAVGVGTSVASDSNMILLFLEWNAEDPVSDFEKQRNPILEGLQGNRNPFIDNPAFATQIWGGPQAEDLFNGGTTDTQAPTAPTNLVTANTTSTSTTLLWTASTDNVAVVSYDIYEGSSLIDSSVSTSYTVSGLSANTSYTFSVKAKDAAGNSSTASNTANVVTNGSSGGGAATDLIISEYIEGSSNNKALEIANFTGTTIDLSDYDLRKVTNGSGSWGSTYQLSGLLATGDVFVIANSSAVSAVTSVADVTTGSGIVTFNGNDAVGLFKNGTLIDLIGTPSSSAYFAQNTTLRRIPSVTSPNASYVEAEWEVLAQDSFDALGIHTMNGTPNPPASEVLIESYFESGWDTWIDGGGDCARYSGSRSAEGSYSIRIRDNSSTASSMTSPEFDITSFDRIEVEFEFYVYSMENGEDFWFRYHDGSSWKTVETWVSGSDIFNNNFYSATVVMNANEYNFVSNGKFRFQNDASSNADQIYIDSVVITAKNTGSSKGPVSQGSLLQTRSLDTGIDAFALYPNPVDGAELHVQFEEIDDQEVVSYRVLSIVGQVLKTGHISDSVINVGDLHAGVYVLEVTLSEERILKRFIKK